MRCDRRSFLQMGGSGLAALLLPGALTRAATSSGDAKLVVIFLRGGADGLSLIAPRGDPSFAPLRPTLASGPGEPIPLDGFFEFHPRLAPLLPLYQSGELLALHAVGGSGSYSHFEAMDAVERAEPDDPKRVTDGWLLRALQHLNPAVAAPLTGISLHASPRTSLRGTPSTLSSSFRSLAEFGISREDADRLLPTIWANFQADASGATRGMANIAASSLTATAGLSAGSPAASYAGGDDAFNRRLQDAARLIKADSLGVKAIAIDLEDWDHHTDAYYRVAARADALARGLSAFYTDLGAAASSTLTLVMTEFGRTAEENGSGGADHGCASMMLALGGGVAGGRVLSRPDPSKPQAGLVTPNGHWPGLAPDELHRSYGQPRDLEATSDFRDVFGEVLERFLGLGSDAARSVLRGYAAQHPGMFV